MFKIKKNKKQLNYFFLIFFIFPIFLSSCSLSREKAPAIDDESWQEEVLVAQDCGFDGLRCCDDEDNPCLYGQTCCIDKNNPEINYCADDCSCGKRGAFCCGDEKFCDEGLACLNDRCVPCGEKDQPCCANSCNNNLVCYYDKCSECGLPGKPCCETGEKCLPNENNDRMECRNGLCAFCGFGGRVSCKTEPLCEPGSLLNNGYCLSCGDLNQPCCSTSTFSSFVCNPQKKLECKFGFCSK